MAQYRTGTVTVTNGDATVTGVGTSWLSNLSIGDIFIRIGDSVPYFVGSITSDTELELTAPYVGVTGSGVSYAVTTDFTPNSALGLLSPTDLETAITFNANMTAIDEALEDRPTNADSNRFTWNGNGATGKTIGYGVAATSTSVAFPFYSDWPITPTTLTQSGTFNLTTTSGTIISSGLTSLDILLSGGTSNKVARIAVINQVGLTVGQPLELRTASVDAQLVIE